MAITPQRMLGVLALLVVGLVIVKSLSPTSPTDSAPPSSDALSQISATVVLPPELSFLQTPREVPTPNPEATWFEVLQISGTENARSPSFNLSGSLVRLRYTLEGDITVLAVYVVPETPGDERVGGFPDVISAGPSGGEALIVRPAGSYYLNVQSVSGTWTVAVEEERLA